MKITKTVVNVANTGTEILVHVMYAKAKNCTTKKS